MADSSQRCSEFGTDNVSCKRQAILAVVVGYGGVQPSAFAGLIPEISLPVARSSAIWVFELP